MPKFSFEKIVNHVKINGFVYPGSEIYGGLANSWDFGPLGVTLKNNIKNAWWKKFVVENKNIVGLDSGIILNPKIWEASGHVATFNDPLIDCKYCRSRFRADKLVEEHDSNVKASAMSNEELEKYITEHISCPNCGHNSFTNIRQFQLMFKTSIGVVEDSKSLAYLRPETAQGIFVNYKNALRSSRKKIPFGIAQIGKAFRNEITPGNFTFRTREFEQMELEFFCKPGTDLQWHEYWKEFCKNFLTSLGMNEGNMRLRDHDKEELSHYSNATTDIEFAFPFGWGELWGIADRTDFDLNKHMEHSKEDMNYLEEATGERYVPYCIEPSLGCDRVALAFLCDSYNEEEIGERDIRTVLKLHPALAPYKAVVLPLNKKIHSEKATEIYRELNKYFMTSYDEAASIGKRYRRADAIGTPFAITVDDETLTNGTVTIRDRDTMEQVTLKVEEVRAYIEDKMKF